MPRPSQCRQRGPIRVAGNHWAIDECFQTAKRESSVTTRMVAKAADLGDSVVRPVMLRLEAAGVVQAQTRLNGPRSALHYQVQQGELWVALTAIVKALSV